MDVPSKYIKIANMHVSDNKLVIKLNFSEDISKYFVTDYFVTEYDKKIDNVDKSILSIPVLSTVVTVAWATGADIYVEYLDKTYLDALNSVEAVFREWFPQFAFSTKIHVRNVISNKFNNRKGALLFSGGLDSLTTYIRNKEEQPTLINVWGADNASPMYKNYECWSKVRNKLLRFANPEGIDIHFIKTNTGQLINNDLLAEEYGIEEGWWEEVSHGLIYTGLSAPITIERIGTVFIASSFTKDFEKRWGSSPKIDNNISWGDIKVIHDGYELSRMEKIKVVKRYPKCLPYLRVCYSQFREHNCGICEKCLRTITGLVLEDIDPKECNFDIKSGILDLIKAYFNNGLLNLKCEQIFFWRNIQQHIPDNLDNDKLYNSKNFFEWFKKLDLLKYKYRGDSKLPWLLEIYYLTKYSPIYSFRHYSSMYFRRMLRYITREFKKLMVIVNRIS